MNNPNENKYFDHRHGMTFNRKCPRCDTPTWVREGINTCYETKHYHYARREDGDVVGVLVNGEIWCHPCYQKDYTDFVASMEAK